MVLLILSIPEHLEFGIEQFVNMLQWDVIIPAAFRWHMLRILDRHLKNSLQAFMAHSVAAGQFR